MCRRYAFYSSAEAAGKPLNARPVDFFSWQPRYNSMPGRWMPVVTNEFPNVVQFFRWGLTPQWAKDDKMGLGMYNTYAGKIKEKPAFEKIFKYKRCVVLADGWFHLPAARAGKQAQTLYVHAPGKEPMFFAGLWDVWGDGLYSFSIVTVAAGKEQAKLFPEIPLVLNKEQVNTWLNKLPAGNAQTALLALPAIDFEYYIVNPGPLLQGMNEASVIEKHMPPGEQPALF